MRALFLAALLIAALVPLPGAAAKGITEDASGDPQLSVLGQPTVAAPGGQGEAVDLLSLDVAEDAEDLTFTLAITNLAQPVSFAEYGIFFTWAKDEYTVYVQRQVLQGALDEYSEAYLVSEEEGRFDALAYLEHEVDVAANTITIHLPKAYLLSENGRYPLLGDALTDLYVEGRAHLAVFQFSTDAYDRMPDGEETVKYDFLFGDVQAGSLRMDADERVRVSNGGATTFVYQVAIQNKADDDQQVAIDLNEMPDGWNGTVQSPVTVPGGSERRVAILVSVPFAHEHGGFSSFNVTATSEDDPASFASVRLGVLHTPIPQPAGHHSELYLHARDLNSGIFGTLFPWTGATMNTDGAHEEDLPEASPNGFGEGISWGIMLAPGLRMGLDFDLDRVGELAGAIVGHTKSTGTVRAELVLTTPEGEESLLLADSDEVDLALDVSTPAPFKLTITPSEESDYVPYLRGQNMMLVLYYEPTDGDAGNFCCIGQLTPGLTTADFKMTLPLNEYHDKLTGLSEGATALDLDAEGPVEKAGLPGATMTYAFTLTNNGKDAEIIEIDLAGTDADLGTLVPAESFELGAKESRLITLAVSVPTGRNEGEEIEVLLFAHAQADPSKTAIARTKTIIAKAGSEDIVGDESDVLLAAQQAEENDTPLGGSLVAVGGFAAAALMLRRRRG